MNKILLLLAFIVMPVLYGAFNTGQVMSYYEEDTDGRTPLHVAAEMGNLPMAEVLLEAGADVNARDNLEYTPLHLAANTGNVPMVQTLMIAGADVNEKDTDGRTLLHVAAMTGNLLMAQILIDFYAELNLKDDDGNTPLQLAEAQGNHDVVELLRRSEDKASGVRNSVLLRTPLYWAAKDGVTDKVRKLVFAGAKVNRKDADGRTLLHVAAETGNLPMAEALLRVGADVNVRDKHGRTPYRMALGAKNLDLAKLLRDRGLEIAALCWAAEAGNFAEVKRLVDAGANVNASNKQSRTPLQCAKAAGNHDVVQLLRDRGAAEVADV